MLSNPKLNLRERSFSPDFVIDAIVSKELRPESCKPSSSQIRLHNFRLGPNEDVDKFFQSDRLPDEGHSLIDRS